MAKRRRVTGRAPADRGGESLQVQMPLFSGVRGLNPLAIAVGILSGTIVYVTYYPSDSVEVEKGDALWLAVLSLVIVTIACAVRFGWSDEGAPANIAESAASTKGPMRWATWGLDLVPWLLAAWMMLSAWASCPPGNLRFATNEAWLWVTGASLFSAVRILSGSVAVRRNLVGLLVICGCGLAVHGMHQSWISLPETRADYRRDPEAVLRAAMLDAPPGSSERMVFENRLMDGGPTATFALANSLAGVLLVTVVIGAGMLAFSWRSMSAIQRMGWMLVVLLCGACLFAARSRSAALAMWIALAVVFIASSRILARRRKLVAWGLSGLLAVGGVGVLALAWLGNREWFEQAPASLAFRLQYWRSTWQLSLDQPWFGAGPGNFQSIYERYREASAMEQIAEPHNLVMETLASGGFVAVALLLLLGISLLASIWLRTNPEPNHEPLNQVESDRALGRWVWLGSIASLAMVWLLGWASRHLPDLDASLYVLPAVMGFGWLVVATIDKVASCRLDLIVGIALSALLIHLLVSGGWTIPGVAILVWIAAGMLARLPVASASRLGTSRLVTESPTRHAVPVPVPVPVLGLVRSERLIGLVTAAIAGMGLLLCLWAVSLRPVERARVLMLRASDGLARGQTQSALQILREAEAADPWSPEASLWISDFYRWQLVREGDTPVRRQQWEAALERAKDRAGEDPAVYRMIGAQQMHVFQCAGETRDLDSAAATFAAALTWSPANQWMFAQVSAIERARGNSDLARRYAATADALSRQGGNIERELSRQLVYVPQQLGAPAQRGPIRVAADRLLFEPKAGQSRNSAQ